MKEVLTSLKSPLEIFDANRQFLNQRNVLQQEFPSEKEMSRILADLAAQASTSGYNAELEVNESDLSKRQKGNLVTQNKLSKASCSQDDSSIKGQEFADGVTNIQSQSPLSKNLNSDVKLEPPKAEKQGKVACSKGASAPCKRNYDPELFFKVNGKLYQRLGKIGSGGSSEVHKVISSDCTIYALKKIKLKGRDYASAFGFCQEIEYLNRLKGKNNIINLIDYEVTDKNLLREVMNGCMSNKDGRVKDDGYLYMQILQAFSTIHEERIVHSVKPANFLLVKGSLELIDFGIAKAIMSDTTHIQRDLQVGTLSYMSPEAFMCNERCKWDHNKMLSTF